jgi:hypothetical protein
MEVVGHLTEAVDDEIVTLTCLVEKFDPTHAVYIVGINSALLIATRGHMVQGVRELQA